MPNNLLEQTPSQRSLIIEVELLPRSTRRHPHPTGRRWRFDNNDLAFVILAIVVLAGSAVCVLQTLGIHPK